MDSIRGRWTVFAGMVGLLALLSTPVAAFERTDILDAADKDDPFDAALNVRYEWFKKTSRVTREFECRQGLQACTNAGITDARVTRFNELDFQNITHTMWIDIRIGLWHDIEIYTGLPIVISMQDELSFAPNVDATNSTLYSGNPNTDIIDMSGNKFVGPDRSGFGDMLLGVRGAPLAYERHPEYPDWVVGSEIRFPTADVRRGGNSAPGSGLYEWKIYTDISRRVVDFFEVYFGLWGIIRFPASGTLFKDYGSALNNTQEEIEPGPTLGLQAALNFIPWEVFKEDQRVQIEIGFQTYFNFEGRMYSELFEGLAASPCKLNASCTATKYYREAVLDDSVHTTGLTDYEQFAVYGGWFGVYAQPIKWVNFGLSFSVTKEQSHYITFADIGEDLPDTLGVKDGVIDRPSVPANATPQEVANFLANLPYNEANEYNPVYVESLDLIGHRFFSEAGLVLNIMVNLSGKF